MSNGLSGTSLFDSHMRKTKTKSKDTPSKRIIVIARRFADGEAANNRLLSYVKGFGEAGREVDIIFCITRPDRAKFQGSYPGVHFHYLWESQPAWVVRRKTLSYIVALFQLIRRIGRRDTAFMYFREVPLFYAVYMISKRFFCETTEHPFFKGRGSIAKRLELNFALQLCRRADGLFVISDSLRSYYISRGVSPQKIHIINMFVDTDRFTVPAPDAEEDYIAYCGTVSKYKDGVDCLIRAFADFHRRYPRYKLYLIGDAESSAEFEELRELAENEGVGETTVFTGRVPADRMPGLLSGAKILALARPDNIQARNGFPTKLGEYLATGRPVVVTRVGEIGNFLKDGETCLLAAPDHPAAFAEKLIWAAAHPQEARRIGEQGRKLAFAEFSYRTQTQRALVIMDRTNG